MMVINTTRRYRLFTLSLTLTGAQDRKLTPQGLIRSIAKFNATGRQTTSSTASAPLPSVASLTAVRNSASGKEIAPCFSAWFLLSSTGSVALHPSQLDRIAGRETH